MTALLLTVLIASLAGSLHCAGMCGAFLAFAVGTGQPNMPPRVLLQAAYHGGRLASYALLGAVAGAVGSTLDLGGQMLGLQRTATLIAGGVMVAFGLLILARMLGARLSTRTPRFLETLVARGQSAAMRFPPVGRALAIGLLTVLLPCGWLWPFVLTAAGTAHPLTGGLVMAAFWLGTVPVLAALGVGLQKLAGPLAARLPAVAALAIIAVGLYTIIARFNAAPAIAAMRLDTTQSVEEQAKQAASTLPPCCAAKQAATAPSTAPATAGSTP